MKTSKVIQDIRVYRSNEMGSDHYLMCAKVNCPPRWLNKSNKRTPLKQDEFFKVRLLNDGSIRWLYTESTRWLYTESTRWLYTERVRLHLSNTKGDETDIEKEWKILQNILKSASIESLGTIKTWNRRKYLKIRDGQIKQLIETKKNSYKNGWIQRKKEDEVEYKTNTALAKR